MSGDGHIEVKGSFDSAPPEYFGASVWMRWNEQLVRLLNHRGAPIALHCRQIHGKVSTLHEHQASEKIYAVERGADVVLQKIEFLGPHAKQWAEFVLVEHGVRGIPRHRGRHRQP